MSIKIMSIIFDLPLRPKHKLVMLCLSNYANDDGINVYPSLSTIQRKTSLSRPAVVTAIDDLKADEILSLESRGNVQRQSNRYRINVVKLVALLTSKGDLLVNDKYQSLVNGVNRTSKRGLPDPLIDPSFSYPSVSLERKKPRSKAKTPRRKKETPETDPRSSSSEIQLFREVTGRYPCLEQYDLVIECVQGRTLEQLKPYWQEWHIVRHYRADNIAWLTDWVKQGHMPNGNGNGNGRKDGSQESNAFAALRMARERREAKANGNA